MECEEIERENLGWSNDNCEIEVVVHEIELSADMSEVMNMQILMKGGKRRDTAVTYVHPRPRPWSERDLVRKWITQ